MQSAVKLSDRASGVSPRTKFEFPDSSGRAAADRLVALLVEHRRAGPCDLQADTYLFATLPSGATIRGVGRLRKLRPCAVTRQYF